MWGLGSASTPLTLRGTDVRVLTIKVKGRGTYKRQRRVRGFATGDLIKAVVPTHLKTGGVYRSAEVSVRRTGFFNLTLPDGRIVQGVNAKYCTLLQCCDGYSYFLF